MGKRDELDVVTLDGELIADIDDIRDMWDERLGEKKGEMLAVAYLPRASDAEEEGYSLYSSPGIVFNPKFVNQENTAIYKEMLLELIDILEGMIDEAETIGPGAIN